MVGLVSMPGTRTCIFLIADMAMASNVVLEFCIVVENGLRTGTIPANTTFPVSPNIPHFSHIRRHFLAHGEKTCRYLLRLQNPIEDQQSSELFHLITDSREKFFWRRSENFKTRLAFPNLPCLSVCSQHSSTLRFFIKFVSRVDSSNIHQPTKWPRKQKM